MELEDEQGEQSGLAGDGLDFTRFVGGADTGKGHVRKDLEGGRPVLVEIRQQYGDNDLLFIVWYSPQDVFQFSKQQGRRMSEASLLQIERGHYAQQFVNGVWRGTGVFLLDTESVTQVLLFEISHIALAGAITQPLSQEAPSVERC